ncbi:hypothetical protein JCM11672_11850 [Alkaliphilus crotonatoxidans]
MISMHIVKKYARNLDVLSFILKTQIIIKSEIINIFQDNKVFTEKYLKNLTFNEKQALESLFGNISRIK